MTFCGLLKEKAHKNLALPNNIFFSENIGLCPVLVFHQKNRNRKYQDFTERKILSCEAGFLLIISFFCQQEVITYYFDSNFN